MSYEDRLYQMNVGPLRTYLERFYEHNVVVRRTPGGHGPDGYTEGETFEVLSTMGDLQRDGKALEAYPAAYQNADAILFCKDSIADVEIADTVEVVTDVRTVEATVEEIMYDNNALVLDL